MVRRRKIPVRKHHGVRDPLKQLEIKEKRLAHITNNPPDHNDEQKVSSKFADFKKLIDEVKTGKNLKRRPHGIEDKPNGTQTELKNSDNKFRKIKQFLGESDRDYLRRVNRITRMAISEAKYEVKYGVNVVRNSKTGEISLQKKPTNEIDELLKRKQKEQREQRSKRFKKQPKETMDRKTAKELIKRIFKEEKEEQQQQSGKRWGDQLPEFKTDVVPFGEVVHAPPALTTLPCKAQKHETVPRPGRKDNLLLKELIEHQTTLTNGTKLKNNQQRQITNNGKLQSNGAISKKQQMSGKRKELPAAMRAMLEQERDKMIDIYRQMKKKQ